MPAFHAALDEDRLAEIKARRSRVSSEPWHQDGDEVLTHDDLVVAEVSGFHTPAFIANAPADIDWLVGEVERLRGVAGSAGDHHRG